MKNLHFFCMNETFFANKFAHVEKKQYFCRLK